MYKKISDRNICSHILIWYFDDILGQQVLTTVPELDRKLSDKSLDVLSRLVDVHFDINEWQFNYADKVFSSQNIKFKVFNAHSRGGYMDFVITLYIHPSTFEVMTKTIDVWDFIQIIKEICLKYLFSFDPTNIISIQMELKSDLEDIVHEINQIFIF